MIGVGLTEAESLLLSGYTVETRAGQSNVSGEAVIKTGGSGTATGVFTGPADSYDVDVGWWNEDDGAAKFALEVDGVTVDSWTGTGGGGIATRRVAVDLAGGEEITLVGAKQGGEYARFDFLEVLVDGSTPAGPEPEPKPELEPEHTTDLTTVEMWETAEWGLMNSTYSGNAFDLEADAVFTHRETGETIRTGMFFDGGDAWKFRFTGSLEGTWDFETQSKDKDLDGHSGSVTVTPNDNPNARGFITTHKGKFAIQTEDANTLDPFLFNVYSNLKYATPKANMVGDVSWSNFAGKVDDYAAAADKVGMDVIFGGIIANNALDLGATAYTEHSSKNPDLGMFRAIEDAIIAAQDAGVYIHFWMWGDEERKWTPSGLDGGINGDVDERIQDYIAARLGPLPNWTMGYGFDLHEWATKPQVTAWAKNMLGEMGWDHLLTARDIDSAALDVMSYPDLGHPYKDALANIQSDPKRAHFFEERDVYLRKGGELPLDMETTKDLLWEYALAGGHGGFWGNAWDSARTGYPEPEQLRTFDRFWNDGDRFLFELEARKGVVKNGVAAATPDGEHYVAYVEGTDSVTLDLTGLKGTQKALAVNANQTYAEVPLGTVDAGVHTFSMASESDWVIAVGEF